MSIEEIKSPGSVFNFSRAHPELGEPQSLEVLGQYSVELAKFRNRMAEADGITPALLHEGILGQRKDQTTYTIDE